MCPIRNMNFHCDLWTGLCGRPAQWNPPSPHPQLAPPMKELLSLLMWQLPAAQELYRHLSTPSPPLSVLTHDYIHSYIYYMFNFKTDFIRMTTVVFSYCQESVEFSESVIRVQQFLHFIFIKLTIFFHKSRFFSSKFSVKFDKFA
jgi:hypothetical protein